VPQNRILQVHWLEFPDVFGSVLLEEQICSLLMDLLRLVVVMVLRGLLEWNLDWATFVAECTFVDLVVVGSLVD